MRPSTGLMVFNVSVMARTQMFSKYRVSSQSVIALRNSRSWPSVQLEIAVLERDQARLVPVLMAEIEHDENRDHEIAGDEVEPGEHRCLKHADVGAEQHRHEQDQCEPRAVRVELGFEFEVVEAAALRNPGLAKSQMTNRNAEPDQETAQAQAL